MEIQIYNYRSVRQCLCDAYHTLVENIRPVLRRTWWAVLPCAMAMAVTTYFFLPNKALHDWGESNPMASFGLQTGVYALTTLLNLLVLALFWSLINQRRWLANLGRVTIVTLVSLAIGVIIGLIHRYVYQWLTGMVSDPAELAQQASSSSLLPAITIFSTSAALVVMELVAAMPLIYCFTHFMMTRHWLPFTGYGRGFRHWGSIFITLFLATILIALALVVVMIPAAILIAAQLKAQLGALGGDPLNLPSYFTPLILGVLTLLYFFAHYTTLWAQLAFAYLYGKIETQHQDKIRHERETH